MIKITSLAHDPVMDRWVYDATFTHESFEKQINGSYFDGSLTEDQVRDKVKEQYDNWIEWLT